MKARAKTYELLYKATRYGIDLDFESMNTLRRASLTLSSWGEMECNYWVDRETVQGKIFRQDENGRRYQIADRETGAINRVKAICEANGIYFYHQTDPRGAAIYIASVPLNSQNYSQYFAIC